MPAESWADLLANAGDAAQTRELLPADDYPVVVEKAETLFAKSGNKMYKLHLVVESGPHEKRKLWKNLVIAQSSGGLGMFFRQMAALTLDAKFFASNPDDDIITEHLVGKRATAKVIVKDKPDGTPGNDVDFINAPKGPAPAGAVTPGVSAAAGSGPTSGPVDAPPVTLPKPSSPPTPTPAPKTEDPWAGSTPPSMSGLGEDPF